MDDEIKRSLQELNRKTDLFIKILELVPDGSIWGLGEICEDIWQHFSGIREILKYQVNSEFEYQVVAPEIYIKLDSVVKKTLISFLKENTTIWGYIYHQMIFRDSTGYFVAFENFGIIDIYDKIGITNAEINEYKDLGFDIRLSSNVFD